MIMSNTRSARRAADNRLWYASAFARYAKDRRGQLSLSVEEAAELSGLKLCEWAAIETGWVPTDPTVIRAIAATLQVRWSDLELLAIVARCAQEEEAA
jgi:transcriptional regulator with XRE-family HTH domain